MSAPGPATVLRVRDLGYAHPGQAPLFAGWSADIAAGLTRIDGDSGSGKTTLLRLLAGELSAAGELALLGRPLADDAAAYRRQVCWFDPGDEAFDALTPEGLMAARRAIHPALDLALWQRHLAGFGLLPHLHKPIYMLSTGSRRKAALAAALSEGCALTLLDEPGAGLDRAALSYLAQALAAAGSPPQRALLLVTSHGLEGLQLAETICLPPSRNG